MRNTKILAIITILCVSGLFCGCSVSTHSMKHPNYHIEFYKADFEYSDQLMAQATSVRILGIDWQRLFSWKSGYIDYDGLNKTSPDISINSSIIADPVIGGLTAVIPVLGNYGQGRVSTYALYTLMKENPGYDIVIYPQYEMESFIVPVFYSKRTVTVTARLGKIK